MASSARVEGDVVTSEKLTKGGRVDDEDPSGAHRKTVPRDRAPSTLKPRQSLRRSSSKVGFLKKEHIRVFKKVTDGVKDTVPASQALGA